MPVLVAVHGPAALGVEEVESPRVDDQAQGLTLARGRLGMDPRDEDRARVSQRLDELPDVCSAVGRSGDRKVDEHLRSERLSQAADGEDRACITLPRGKGRVL